MRATCVESIGNQLTAFNGLSWFHDAPLAENEQGQGRCTACSPSVLGLSSLHESFLGSTPLFFLALPLVASVEVDELKAISEKTFFHLFVQRCVGVEAWREVDLSVETEKWEGEGEGRGGEGKGRGGEGRGRGREKEERVGDREA